MPTSTRNFDGIKTAASQIVKLDAQYNAEIGVASIREDRIDASGAIEVRTTYVNTVTGSVYSMTTVNDQLEVIHEVEHNVSESVQEKGHEFVTTKTQMILNLEAEGLSVVEIAKELGLRYQHVANTLIRKDRPLRLSRKQPDSNVSIVAKTVADLEDPESQ